MNLSCEIVFRVGDREIVVRKPNAVIGRGGDADVVVEAGSVSRRHCEVIVREGGVHVRDLDSRHGTWLGERRVGGEIQVRGPTLLGLGRMGPKVEVLAARFGSMTFMLHGSITDAISIPMKKVKGAAPGDPVPAGNAPATSPLSEIGLPASARAAPAASPAPAAPEPPPPAPPPAAPPPELPAPKRTPSVRLDRPGLIAPSQGPPEPQAELPDRTAEVATSPAAPVTATAAPRSRFGAGLAVGLAVGVLAGLAALAFVPAARDAAASLRP